MNMDTYLVVGDTTELFPINEELARELKPGDIVEHNDVCARMTGRKLEFVSKPFAWTRLFIYAEKMK